jgi:hypothetical protein
MVFAFTIPWWTADISAPQASATLDIYGWGIPENTGPLEEYIAADVTPAYQTQLAWAYVGISAAAGLAATWLKGKKGQLLLGLAGIGLAAYALVAAFMVITNRLGEMGIALEGTPVMPLGSASITIIAGLGFGFYLACITGGLLILLALLKGVVVGEASRFIHSADNDSD